MGLVELFIANIFDIYPSEKFVANFIDEKSLNLSRILDHPLLVLSMTYDYLWNRLFDTHPTKRDFMDFLNTHKISIAANAITYDKMFIEKILNSYELVKFGFGKKKDMMQIFNDVQEYIVDLKNHSFVETQLIKKWQYRFSNQERTTNLLMTFCAIYKGYEPPNIYCLQINPITQSYIETIEFNDKDLHYMTEAEQIQYTLYADHHFMLKIVDNVGIMCDIQLPSHLLHCLINLAQTQKPVILFNCNDTDIDPAYNFRIPSALAHILPAGLQTFIYISNKEYPDQRSLAYNRDFSIYYCYDQTVKNVENKAISKTYDRTILNRVPNEFKLNEYIVLDFTIPLEGPKIEILVGPKTYDIYKDKFAGLNFTCNPHCRPKFVIDYNDEFDLVKYMAQGCIPIVNKTKHFIKNMITGIVASGDPVVVYENLDPLIVQSIIVNSRYLAFLTDESFYTYHWKHHLQLSCQTHTINTRNGFLIYLTFTYFYFIKCLQNIIGAEDKHSRGTHFKVVLVDNRPNPLSVLSVLFALANLNPSWSCKIYTTQEASSYYEKHLGNVAEIVHHEALKVPKFHIDVYNNLLKDADFWKSIDAEKTLIIQDDGVLLRSCIDKFLQYDYIGASWVDSVPNMYIKKNISQNLVGNGGLSLRSNKRMIEICEKFIKEKTWLFYKNMTQIPEDVYFVYGLEKLGAKMPSYQEGSDFSSEEICNMSSKGLHKLWSYHIAETTFNYLNGVLRENA